MRTEIARLDVSNRSRSLIAYVLGMALYAFVVVALYPSFEHSTSLDKLVRNDSTAAALFGVTGPLSSVGGWLNGNIYANFFPLVLLLVTVGYGAASLAGQDEDGTLCLIATLPLPRTAVVLQKVAAMTVQAAALTASVAACVVVGRSFDLTVTIADVVSISVAACLMGIDFGLIAMAAGGFSGRRTTAAGIGAAVAAASYLVGTLATVVSWMRPLRYLSLFYWSVGDDQVTRGVSLADYAVLIAAGLGALCAALVAFRRLDLH